MAKYHPTPKLRRPRPPKLTLADLATAIHALRNDTDQLRVEMDTHFPKEAAAVPTAPGDVTNG